MLNRIKKYIDYKGISISAFEKSLNMSNNSFGKTLKKNGGSIGSDKIERIMNKYTDINPEWLLTGNGEMIKPQQLYVNGNNNISNISNTGDIVNVGSCSKEEIIEVLKEVKDKQEEILKILLTQRKK